MQTRKFGDFDLACLSRAGLVELCLNDIASDERRLVFDANGQALSLARTDAGYRHAITSADLIHADGGFLIGLSRLLPGPAIPERSATTDMIHDLAVALAPRSGRFFLLGGSEDVNRAAAQALAAQYPGLKIAGRAAGYFDMAETDALIERINASRADVVWIGMGKPAEQIIAARWRGELTAPWVVTCGGCFDFLAGQSKRAPLWMQNSGLEWLFRLSRDPKRLLKRYALTSPHAVWIALRGPRFRRTVR